MKRSTLVLAALVSFVAVGWAQTPVSPEVALKAARQREQIDGDENGALVAYRAIIRQFPAHTVAVDALLRSAALYERAGDHPRARESYEQVVAHSKASAASRAEAQARLKAIAPPAVKPARSSVDRVLVTGPEATRVWSRVSADGRYLALQDVPTLNLAIRDLHTNTTRLVTTAKRGEGMVEIAIWSPNAKELAYSWWDQTLANSRMQLRIVDRETGVSRVLFSPPDLDWLEPQGWASDEQNILAVVDRQGGRRLSLISVADGTARDIKTEFRPSDAYLSPDGRFVAYNHEAEGTKGDIGIIDLRDNNERVLMSGPDNDYFLGWFPDGQSFLFGSSRKQTKGAWMAAFANGSTQGEPVLLKANIAGTAGLGFDRSGNFYSVMSIGGTDVFLADIDPITGRVSRQSQRAPLAPSSGRRWQASWSADGRRTVYMLANDDGTFIVDHGLASGETRTTRVRLSNAERPSLFPDGQTVAVEASEQGRQVFKVDLRDGSTARIGPAGQNFWALFPDGQSYLYSGYVDGKQAVLRRNLHDGSDQVLRPGRASAAISPDGTTLAFWIENGNTASISVKPIAGGEERTVLSAITGSANRIAWSHDSRFVFHISNNSEVWRVPAAGGAAIDTGVRIPFVKRISVSPDGSRLALTGGSVSSEVWVWEDLKPQVKGK